MAIIAPVKGWTLQPIKYDEMQHSITHDLNALANPEKAKHLARFFKTGKGQYGEGDIFLGIKVPDQRKIALRYWQRLQLNDLQELLNSTFHEHRLTALLVLVKQFQKADAENQRRIYDFYIRNFERINNWDLVDSSCRDIVGAYLFDKDRSILELFAQTPHLWTQRIAIVATWYFIREKQFEETFRMAKIFVHHPHDLIHKATGWMLREAAKKGAREQLKSFLEYHAHAMPRTMLRYAIEHFSAEDRNYFMQKGK